MSDRTRNPETRGSCQEKRSDLRVSEPNIAQFVEAYRLFIAGKQQAEIRTLLEKNFDKPVSLRTISSWRKYFRDSKRNVSDEKKDRSRPVEWYNLEEYGLPWEASAGLALFRDRHNCIPSWRVLEWWWRLNLLGGWDQERLMKCARWYEAREIKLLFGLQADSLQKLDEEMWKERGKSSDPDLEWEVLPPGWWGKK